MKPFTSGLENQFQRKITLTTLQARVYRVPFSQPAISAPSAMSEKVSEMWDIVARLRNKAHSEELHNSQIYS